MIRAPEEENDAPQKLNPAAEDNVEDRGWKRGSPKKMFKWTDEIRLEGFILIKFLFCLHLGESDPSDWC